MGLLLSFQRYVVGHAVESTSQELVLSHEARHLMQTAKQEPSKARFPDQRPNESANINDRGGVLKM